MAKAVPFLAQLLRMASFIGLVRARCTVVIVNFALSLRICLTAFPCVSTSFPCVSTASPCVFHRLSALPNSEHRSQQTILMGGCQ